MKQATATTPLTGKSLVKTAGTSWKKVALLLLGLTALYAVYQWDNSFSTNKTISESIVFTDDESAFLDTDFVTEVDESMMEEYTTDEFAKEEYTADAEDEFTMDESLTDEEYTTYDDEFVANEEMDESVLDEELTADEFVTEEELTADVSVAEDSVTYLGCFRDVPSRIVQSGKFKIPFRPNNVARCKEFCKGFLFFGMENLQDCFCGNRIAGPVRRISESSCNRKCDGTNEKCGGVWAINLYRQVVPPKPKNYKRLGCYRDRPSRIVNQGKYKIPFRPNNIARCEQYCKGYLYFGMENLQDCFCGNALESNLQKLPDRFCNKRCDGAPETCGGVWAIDLYQRSEVYLGCFRDRPSRIVQSGKFKIPFRPNNVARCREFCKGYTFFGMENLQDCFCGDRLVGPLRISERFCNKKCDGTNEKCGGVWAINLYRQVKTTPLPDYVRIGCFRDRPSRIVEQGKFKIPFRPNNAAKCKEFCGGTLYYGMENLQDCFCGNRLEPNIQRLPDSFCNKRCDGSPETCGGVWAIDLYKKKVDRYLGCFKDVPSRIVKGGKYKIPFRPNNKKLCKAFCKGYKYYGMENLQDCFCGNAIVGARRISEAACNKRCDGSSEKCGGVWAINLYYQQS